MTDGHDWTETVAPWIPLLAALLIVAALLFAAVHAEQRQRSGGSCVSRVELLTAGEPVTCWPGSTLAVSDAGEGRWLATCSCPTKTSVGY